MRLNSLIFMVLLLAGCSGPVSVTPPPPPVVTSPIALPPTRYMAFGDSITFGLGVAYGQSYHSLISIQYGLNQNNDNFGIVGQQACDNANNVVINDVPVPVVGTIQPMVSDMIETNDVIHNGAGPYEATARNCLTAAWSWAAIPSASKIMGNAGITTGTCSPNLWWNDSGHRPGIWGELCTAIGSTDTLSLATAGGPIYIWYQSFDGDTGTWTYSIDGGTPVKISTAMSPPIATGLGGTNGYGLIRIAPVTAGNHTVIFTQLTAGNMAILSIGTPSNSPVAILPYLIVFTLPNQLNGGQQSDVDSYRADELADFNTLHGDGLQMYLIHTENLYPDTTAYMSDQYHPNAAAHQAMYQAILNLATSI